MAGRSPCPPTVRPVTDTREFMAHTDAIGSIGSSFYFAPSTVEIGKEHGLDGFRFYFLGRGGVLGDIEPGVVASAFGYFNPDIVTRMWDSAKAKVAPRDAARLYLQCAHDLARTKLADVEGLDEFNAAMTKVNEAIDPAGLALYSGVRSEPVPDDAPAKAIHMCIALREARGSTHLLAIRAAGLHPRAAHQLKRPDDVAMFGWEPLELTDDDRDKWEQAEALTNDLMEPAWAVLDDAEREAVVAGLSRISTALT